MSLGWPDVYVSQMVGALRKAVQGASSQGLRIQ